MSEQKISCVGIIGSGTMGSGIAELTAVKGYNVELLDINKEIVNAGFAIIEKNIKRMEAKKNYSRREHLHFIKD